MSAFRPSAPQNYSNGPAPPFPEPFKEESYDTAPQGRPVMSMPTPASPKYDTFLSMPTPWSPQGDAPPLLRPPPSPAPSGLTQSSDYCHPTDPSAEYLNATSPAEPLDHTRQRPRGERQSNYHARRDRKNDSHSGGCCIIC